STCTPLKDLLMRRAERTTGAPSAASGFMISSLRLLDRLGNDVNLYTLYVKVYIMGYQEFPASAV
ncbi:MAG: hypothetical protein ACT6WE_08625, partial [Shinella sp.]|uniref:hypothetical protein n=1 Tax=Shinella sp. TaxID=1870904 RepID=UPI00403520C4